MKKGVGSIEWKPWKSNMLSAKFKILKKWHTRSKQRGSTTLLEGSKQWGVHIRGNHKPTAKILRKMRKNRTRGNRMSRWEQNKLVVIGFLRGKRGSPLIAPKHALSTSVLRCLRKHGCAHPVRPPHDYLRKNSKTSGDEARSCMEHINMISNELITNSLIYFPILLIFL